jgi:integrase
MASRRPIQAGAFRGYAVRGPNKAGEHYWVCKWWVAKEEGRFRDSIALGWLQRPDAEREVIALAGSRSPAHYAAIGEVRTVRDLVETWLVDALADPARKPKTKETLLTVARRIVRHLGEHRLDRITPEALRSHVTRRLAMGAKKPTISLEMVYIGSAWTWGFYRGFVATEKLVKPRIPETTSAYRDTTPTPKQVAKVQAYLDRRAAERGEVEAEWAMVHRILWCSGLRCHELVALTWAMVDFVDAEIRIPMNTKTGTRDIPLVPVHVQALQAWQERSGHGGEGEPVVVLSTSLSRGLSYRLVGVRRMTEGRKSSTGACQAVGVLEYTAQGLRRLAVDALYEAAQESRVDVGTVAAIMGHSPATALRHYRTPSKKAKRAAVLAAGLGTVPDRNEVNATA